MNNDREDIDYDSIKEWVLEAFEMGMDRIRKNECTQDELEGVKKAMMHIFNPLMRLDQASDFFKKPKSSHVQNGRKKAASVIMSARWVSMIFVLKTILNKAMIIIAGAINWVTRIKKRIVERNLRR